MAYQNEVHKVFNQLKEVLEAAARRYPVEIAEVETQVRQEKYVMATSTQTSQDQLKCILTITGDSISLQHHWLDCLASVFHKI